MNTCYGMISASEGRKVFSFVYLFAGPKEMSIIEDEDTIQETPIHGESDAAC